MHRAPLNRLFVFLLLAALGLAADLGTKHLMFAWPALQPPGSVWWVWPGHAGFQNSLNEGALFGLGQGQQVMFGLFSVAAAVAIPIWLFWFGAARDWWLTVPLSGVMAGVLGNLYDRMNLHGMRWGIDWPLQGDHTPGQPVHAVRDFILLQINDAWRWANFNVADSFLVVGAATLFLRASLSPPAEATKAKTAEPSDQPKSEQPKNEA